MGTLSRLPAPLSGGPFTSKQAFDLGISRTVLCGKRYVRLFPDVFALAEPAPTDEQLRAAALMVVPHGALSHASAALHWQIPIPVTLRRDCIHVCVGFGSEMSRVRGLKVHELRLDMTDVVDASGIRVTSPARTLLDLAAYLSLADLTAAVDAALRSEIVRRDGLVTAAIDAKGARGVRRLRLAIDLANARSESPQESRTRVALICGGLPAPECNIEIRDRHGRWIARGDLVYEAYKVLVEYDGDVHLENEQRIRDAERRNDAIAAGWTVITFTAESWRDPAAMVRRVWDALAHAGWTPSTAHPPPLASSLFGHSRRPK